MENGLVISDRGMNMESFPGNVTAESEQEFQDCVVDYARSLGWKVAHCRAGRVMRDGKETYETPWKYDGKGFPDLILVRGQRFVIAEMKSVSGKLTLNQIAWIG